MNFVTFCSVHQNQKKKHITLHDVRARGLLYEQSTVWRAQVSNPDMARHFLPLLKVQTSLGAQTKVTGIIS
jgi:hypothetical protein